MDTNEKQPLNKKPRKTKKAKEDIEFIVDESEDVIVLTEQNIPKKITHPKKVKQKLDLEFILEEEESTNNILVKPSVLTEDLGKIFEKAICLLYGIEFDGAFKYSVEEAKVMTNRISKLKDVFPYQLKHIAKNGSKYDFVTLINNVNNSSEIYLSAKTTKKDGKVCPQVIGQPSKKKFCEYFQIEQTNNLEQIKKYIETNIQTMLQIYCENTFDCPIIYYNKHKNKLLFIKLKENIQWSNYKIIFSRTTDSGQWNESSSIKIEGQKNSLGEFQVHNHRDCIKFRWAFENLLALFKDNFDIVTI
jgi:hypothetical protein